MLHRNDDHATSIQGARDVARRAPTQKLRLLVAYRAAGRVGLTAEQAGINSGLAARPLCCYWHRCTDLRDEGWIAPVEPYETRKASAGRHQMVCAITDDGRAELLAREL